MKTYVAAGRVFVLWVVVVLTVKAGVLVIGVGDGHVTIFVGHGRIGFVV